MPDATDLSLLERLWVHSQEESSEDRLVFRPSDFAFRPSRGGRNALEMASGGEVSVRQPGPADRSVESKGGWSIKGKILTITGPLFAGTYTIDTLNPDVLILKKKEG